MTKWYAETIRLSVEAKQERQASGLVGLNSRELDPICYAAPHSQSSLLCYIKPNTHRRRDETVLSRRIASALAVCTWIRDDCRRIRRCERTTHTDDTTKLSPTSCEFVYTPPTQRDSTVSSRRRRRCVLGCSHVQTVLLELLCDCYRRGETRNFWRTHNGTPLLVLAN